MTTDWSRKFDEPIPLAKGRPLVTLKDAGTYIAKLPKTEHMTAEWQFLVCSADSEQAVEHQGYLSLKSGALDCDLKTFMTAGRKENRSMPEIVNISDLAGLCAAFGNLGAKVGPRTGRDKRTQDDTEWFVVRRFLKVALREGILKAPISVQKQNPPLPDFGLQFGNAIANLEITEATDPTDQEEMTKFERSGNSMMLLGAFGGRFSDGASQPGRTWASDVIDAINRKGGKAIFEKSDIGRHLVIYPNSNASALVCDAEDERAAFGFLRELIEMDLDGYINTANGCLVHVLGKELVGFDVLGRAHLANR